MKVLEFDKDLLEYEAKLRAEKNLSLKKEKESLSGESLKAIIFAPVFFAVLWFLRSFVWFG